MGETTFAVDPEGDVVLVLRNPSAPFAVISQSLADPEPASTPVSSPSPSRFFKKSKIPKPAPPTPPAQPVFRYLLSSRHLIMASEYFQRLLKGPWKEANSTDADGRRTIQAEDWDPDALLILMYVIHGRNNRVPRSPGLEMLAKVAVLVDYYRCHEAVQVHKYFWYLRLNELVPKIGNGRLILWLLVASVFQWTETLADAKGTALQHFDGRIPTLGLPVIDGIADELDKKRQECIQETLTFLSDLLTRLRDGTAGCSFSCSSMMLGALTKHMHKTGLLDLSREPPYLGRSIGSIISALRKVRTPNWREVDADGDPRSVGMGRSCTCALSDFIEEHIAHLEKNWVDEDRYKNVDFGSYLHDLNINLRG